jgi:hypothetical protein
MADTNTNSTLGSENPDAKRHGQPQPPCHRADGYEIRVRDQLETYWLNWFEGWSVTNLEDGEVLLKSMCVDQSKLHGALNKIRDLNLTLLTVRCVQVDDETVRPDKRG